MNHINIRNLITFAAAALVFAGCAFDGEPQGFGDEATGTAEEAAYWDGNKVVNGVSKAVDAATNNPPGSCGIGWWGQSPRPGTRVRSIAVTCELFERPDQRYPIAPTVCMQRAEAQCRESGGCALMTYYMPVDLDGDRQLDDGYRATARCSVPDEG
jgi:hypothetical protein